MMKYWIRSFTLVISFMLIVSACQWSHYPPIENLLIDVSVFPSDWQADADGPEPDPSAPFGGIRSVERTELNFYSDVSGAFENIERFKSSRKAYEEFVRQKDFLFKSTEFQGPYEIPEELPYRSDLADQFYFACWRPEYTSILGCDYLAQYGPYLVHFNLGWNPGALTVSELEKILRAIDDKMANYADR